MIFEANVCREALKHYQKRQYQNHEFGAKNLGF